MMKKIRGMKFFYEIALVTVSFLWAMGFIWTKQGIDLGFSPAMFTLMRYTMAALIMLPFCNKELRNIKKSDILYGLLGGLILYASMSVQTVALSLSTPSSTAFITTTYVVMVPFISWMVVRKRPHLKVYACAAMTLVGMYILTMKPGETFEIMPSTYMLVFSAVLFAVHVVYTEIVSKKMNAKLLVVIPFIFVSIFSGVQGVVMNTISFDTPNIAHILVFVFLTAAVSSIIAGFLQIIAQKHVNSSRAAIIFALESVFTAAVSILYGMEILNLQLLVGGSIIIIAIILSELHEQMS